MSEPTFTEQLERLKSRTDDFAYVMLHPDRYPNSQWYRVRREKGQELLGALEDFLPETFKRSYGPEPEENMLYRVGALWGLLSAVPIRLLVDQTEPEPVLIQAGQLYASLKYYLRGYS